MTRTTRSAQRTGRGFAYTIAVPTLAVLAVIAAITVAGSARDELADLAPSNVPVSAAVVDAQADYSAPATAALTVGFPDPVLSPGLAGTVTSVDVTPGVTLTTGDSLYRVDGVAVTAYSGSFVFYRPLSVGTRGADVTAAQELLSALVPDADLEADGLYGTATAAVMRTFEESIGVTRPTGTFRPELFARLGEPDFDVATVALTLGAAAPGKDAEIVAGAAAIIETSVTGPTSGPDGDYEFITSGLIAPLTKTGDTWTLSTDDAAGLLSTPPSGTEPVVLEGRTRLADPAPAQPVPAGALITSPSGGTCVAIVDGEDTPITPVVILGSAISGELQIEPELAPGTQVLLNPYQVLGDDVQCP